MKMHGMLLCAMVGLSGACAVAEDTAVRKGLQTKLETLMRRHAKAGQYMMPRGLHEEMALRTNTRPLSLTFGYNLHQALWKKLTGSSKEYEPTFELPKEQSDKSEWVAFKEHVTSLRKDLSSGKQTDHYIELFAPRKTPLVDDFQGDFALTSQEKDLVNTLLPKVEGVYEPLAKGKAVAAPSQKAPSNLKDKVEALMAQYYDQVLRGAYMSPALSEEMAERDASAREALSIVYGYNLLNDVWKKVAGSQKDFEPQFSGPKSDYLSQKENWLLFREKRKKLIEHKSASQKAIIKTFAPRTTPLWKDFQDRLKLTDQEMQQLNKLLPSAQGIYEPINQ